NPAHPLGAETNLPAGVEVLTLAELRGRPDAALLTRPLRSTRHHLLTPTSGSLRHAVDFTEHTLRPGNGLWARPGQVQQWGGLEDAEGTLVMFEGGFLDPDTAIGAGSEDPHAPVMRVADAEAHPILRVAASQLQWEFGATE